MIRQRPIGWLPTPAGLFGLTLFGILIAARGDKLLIDGDTYTHIRCGEWMLEHRALLKADIFSHTIAGAPWVAHEWGSQILMAWLHALGGLPAVAVFFAAIIALSMTVVYRLLERLDFAPGPALAMMAAFLLLFSPTMVARPHVFTWLFGAITIDLLQRRGRMRLWLPLLTLVWANLHGGFLFGLALQGIDLAGRILDRLPQGNRHQLLPEVRGEAAIVAASAAAGLCTPFGIEPFLVYAAVSSQEISRFNPEWSSPNFQDFWPFRLYLAVLLLLLLANGRRPGWTNLILLGLFLNAALAHRRHVSLAAIALLPLWVEQFHARGWFRTPATAGEKEVPCSAWSGPLLLGIAATTLILVLAQRPAGWQPGLERQFPVSSRFPNQVMNWLEQNPQPGKVFNEYTWGAALIYRTNGGVPVFIDGFADKYGAAIYRDYYRIAHLEKEADALLDSYRIDWVLFPSDAPLVRYLLLTSRWELAYRDGQASVLIRKAPIGG